MNEVRMLKRETLARLVKAVDWSATVRDLVGVGGVAAVAYGSWMIFPPAGWIVGGLIMIAGAFLAAKAS